MTDRELLELAAKAAGIEICFGPWPMRYVDAQDQEKAFTVKWNPLDDDGDALRLAVLLHISIEPDATHTCATAPWGPIFWEAVNDSDHYAATRLAIVRAAAEIGKKIK